MKESSEENIDKSKSLLDDYEPDEELDNNEIEDKDEFNDKSCVSKCCFYLWCCCCCHSRLKSRKFYQKGWRNYLVKEGNE